MLGIGLLGAGRIGRIHGRNVAENRKARLVGVADVELEAARALAASLDAPVRTTDEILSDPVTDAVIIASSTDTHADLIEQAARAGKAIFCEKPVDLSSERIERCLEVVRAAGVPLMIGFNRRFDPHVAALKARVDAGEVGETEIITILSRDPAPPPISYIERSGGLFRDMMIHDLDLARFFAGRDPVEIYAAGSSLVDPAIKAAGDWDTAVVTLKFASGALCQISNSRRAAYGYDQRIEVHGSKGMLRTRNLHETSVEAADANGFRTDRILDFFLERYALAYRNELDRFIDAVVGGASIRPNGEDGLAAQRLADAATRSAQTGEPQRL